MLCGHKEYNTCLIVIIVISITSIIIIQSYQYHFNRGVAYNSNYGSALFMYQGRGSRLN